jgi:hypothetical protein
MPSRMLFILEIKGLIIPRWAACLFAILLSPDLVTGTLHGPLTKGSENLNLAHQMVMECLDIYLLLALVSPYRKLKHNAEPSLHGCKVLDLAAS